MALKKEKISIDEKEYTFTSLPMTPKTLKWYKVLDKGDGIDRLESLLLMLEKSLSYEHTEEEIDSLFESGTLNEIFLDKEGINGELRDKIMTAAVSM